MYIENQSMLLDLKILMLTFKTVFTPYHKFYYIILCFILTRRKWAALREIKFQAWPGRLTAKNNAHPAKIRMGAS